MLGAAGEAGTSHALAQAAFFEEVLFETLELLIEEVVCLMDQANENIGDGFRRVRFDELAEVLVGEIGVATQFADIEGFFGAFLSLDVTILAEVVAVIPEEFLQATPGDVGEFDFRFLGCARYPAAFSDVFVTAAGRLHHLIVGAGALVDEAVAKAHGGIVNDLGFLVAVELFIAAVRRDESFLMRRM